MVLLHALHSLPHSVVEVVVARLDHLGYQLKEGVRSEVVGMVIPVLLSVTVIDGGAARSGIFSGSELKLHLEQYFLL